MNHYYLLGRSGLRVSRLALGTMNFGGDGFRAPYGKTEAGAAPIFGRYVEPGGNFRSHAPLSRRYAAAATACGGGGLV